VDRAQGAWLYGQVLEQGARNVVEFGASFGISAIWMGAAVGQTGGRVVTTEIEPAKIQAATVNIAEAGLDGTVRLLGGDAVERLRDHPGPVDLLFFDGWVDRYMPLLDRPGRASRLGGGGALGDARGAGAVEAGSGVITWLRTRVVRAPRGCPGDPV